MAARCKVLQQEFAKFLSQYLGGFWIPYSSYSDSLCLSISISGKLSNTLMDIKIFLINTLNGFGL